MAEEYSEEELIHYIRGKWMQANAQGASITKEKKYELCIKFKKPTGIRRWMPQTPFPALLKKEKQKVLA